jgi:hypothetical protein
MKIEMGKAYQTKDGRSVRLLCVDGPGDRPVVGFVQGIFQPLAWDMNGRIDKNEPMLIDLVPAKTKRSGWVNVYRIGEKRLWSSSIIYTTKSEAEKGQSWSHYAATVQIEWEEWL